MNLDMIDANRHTKKIEEGFVGQKMIVLPPKVHEQVAKNHLINGLYLTNVGFYPKASFHDRERKRGCPQYILLYCVEGKGIIHIGDQEFHLPPNHYFIIPRNVPHHYRSSDTDPWSIYWVHFEGENSDLLYARYTEDRQAKISPIPYDEHRVEIFDQLFDILEKSFDPRSLELVNFMLVQFLSSFIYHEEMFPSYYGSDQIIESINFMKSHLHENYSLKELAHQQHISVSHYADLFKRKTGRSPIQYFNQLKIHKSCQYLYFTDMSIKEICVELGIDDPYYFSRLFKKMMGLSPAKYRNNYKRSTGDNR